MLQSYMCVSHLLGVLRVGRQPRNERRKKLETPASGARVMLVSQFCKDSNVVRGVMLKPIGSEGGPKTKGGETYSVGEADGPVEVLFVDLTEESGDLQTSRAIPDVVYDAGELWGVVG